MFAIRRLARLPVSCARAPAPGYAPARLLSTSLRRFNADSSSSATSASALSSASTVPSLFTPAPGDTKPFFITTPIFYVNASPHIGHLHSVVLADVFARFARLRHPHREVIFCTGTDEHGLKIQQAAAKGGMSEQAFCDDVSERFRNLSKMANISHTDFVRTSEARHYAAVEAFWGKLVASGAVYKGSHSGWYSVSDECFYAATQVEEVDGVMVATETGSEVSWQEEENWKFRLSMFAGQVGAWLDKTEAVFPPHEHALIRDQVANLPDLSISRPSSRVSWGVPVPGDASQTIYVWVDALINYITVAGYPGAHAAWPADLHIVGKDIIKFHSLHWPALLAAAGEALPKRVLAHAHWTMGRAKMSKSRGNVADPIAAMGTYGVDVVRWYLMSVGGSLPADADYAEPELANTYGRLQDQLGNLVARVSAPSMLERVRERPWDAAEGDAQLDELLRGARDRFEAHFEGYDLSRAADTVFEVLGVANRIFTHRQPWNSDDSTACVTYAYEALRIAAILAQPIMPSKAAECLDRLGVPAAERTWESATWSPETNYTAPAEIARRITAGRELFKDSKMFPRLEAPKAKEDKAPPKPKKAKKQRKTKVADAQAQSA